MIDRLSRSLLDFAKLIEELEQHRVSLVSVTQQMDTSTSSAVSIFTWFSVLRSMKEKRKQNHRACGNENRSQTPALLKGILRCGSCGAGTRCRGRMEQCLLVAPSTTRPMGRRF